MFGCGWRVGWGQVAGGCALAEHAATCPDNVTVANNTLVTSAVWPAAALAIEREAGLTGRVYESVLRA